jgi:hypothetical protein
VGATPAVAGAVDTGATARIVRGVGRDASTGAGTSEVAFGDVPSFWKTTESFKDSCRKKRTSGSHDGAR